MSKKNNKATRRRALESQKQREAAIIEKHQQKLKKHQTQAVKKDIDVESEKPVIKKKALRRMQNELKRLKQKGLLLNVSEDDIIKSRKPTGDKAKEESNSKMVLN